MQNQILSCGFPRELSGVCIDSKLGWNLGGHSLSLSNDTGKLLQADSHLVYTGRDLGLRGVKQTRRPPPGRAPRTPEVSAWHQLSLRLMEQQCDAAHRTKSLREMEIAGYFGAQNV